jgi:hypothetical protein
VSDELIYDLMTMRTKFNRMKTERDAAIAAVQDLRRKCGEEDYAIQQTLGKALGYPWFKDDPANFPDATEDDGVCVGEHVGATLAMQAAERIAGLASAVRTLRAALKPWMHADGCFCEASFAGPGVLISHHPDCRRATAALADTAQYEQEAAHGSK